ncbi:IucA/IucC family siderophore biosynthesis protein [Pseudomonas sp. gcc21]|uniref:IucA/IucC family protein n=1 Tax=Pseudomonas sp. gcc21 TaxID=2726989 RepID=UPI00145141A2|nr:IucA/IucC family siderophore biosynthesis protein [Pseudomonas sp. gcc21]QJD58250.1 IucA/IucC family siderophore biosynthesis protein [Pseudomonas sp. gcc21]
MEYAQLQIGYEDWRGAGQRLIEMLIAEFSYEEIIEPQKLTDGTYLLRLGELVCHFRARRYQLGHWLVEPGSARVQGHNEPASDLNAFILAIGAHVNVQPFTLTHLVRELNNTRLAEAHLLASAQLPSDQIIELSASEVEGVMRGHPWIVMSKGRVGFGYEDYLTYAPERRTSLALPWVAVHRDLAQFNSTSEWSQTRLYQSELDEQTLSRFFAQVAETGVDPDEFFLLPVHPWQWHDWILPSYAGDIAAQRIILLGSTGERHLPMQSIRTFSNASRPAGHYIKLSLSILNTAVYRGLPNDRNKAAPAVTAWLQEMLASDHYLRESGLVLLGEVATVTVSQPAFDAIEGAPYQFRELFGCLWRESVEPRLQSGEQAITQAALVHRDGKGRSVLEVLISRSGLSPQAWLSAYFHVCVPPLLHWLYRYGVAFSAHGENSLLVHEGGVPKKMVLKDFVDDVCLVEEAFPELQTLPPEASVLNRLPAAELAHFVFSGLFVVHYRFICAIFTTDFGKDEVAFWQLLADVVDEFHRAHPQLQERIQRFALQRPAFEKVCLNRVRLFSRGYADAAERPEPVVLNMMPNPINRDVLKRWSLPARTGKTAHA